MKVGKKQNMTFEIAVILNLGELEEQHKTLKTKSITLDLAEFYSLVSSIIY